MKKALISPNEKISLGPNQLLGVRVCDIGDEAFEVASPLYWVDCEDHISGSTHCYYEEVKKFVMLPPAPPVPEMQTQPVTQGAQTL